MHAIEQRNHHKGCYISASMLMGTGCPRQVVYERTHDLYDYPTRRFWPMRGTLMHALIEDAPASVVEGGWMQELRLSYWLEYDEPAPIFDANGVVQGFDPTQKLRVELGGTTDAYNPVRLRLDDFKSMGDEKAEGMALAGHAKDAHEAQANVYRLLVARTKIDDAMLPRLREVGFDPTGHEYLPAPETLTIQGVSMMHLVQTGQEQEIKVKIPGPRGGLRTERRRCRVEAVRVWPLAETEAWVRPRVYQWYRWLVLGELPPVVPEAEKWLCASCPFNADVAAGGICHPVQERLRAALTDDLIVE